jgi:hypothetical protein
MLVKVKHNCILCNHEVEEYDRTQMSEKEYYLTFWKYELGTPEAEEAWKQKQSMTKRDAPMVQSDIQGYISQIDGSWIDSKSKHRNHLKQHGCIEVGNEKQSTATPKQDPKLKQRIAEIAYEKLRYR